MNHQEIVDTFKPLVKNKHVIAVVVFVVWLTFFDEDTFFVRYELSRKVSKLEEERDRLKDGIEQTQRKMDELKSDRDQLEKFAREEYFMKKDDEVIFIVK